MNRRGIMAAGLATAAATAGGPTAAQPAAGGTYLLVHGAWHGAWCWVRVADRLRAAGHRVLTVTQTGLADRRHLLSRDITLDTFTADVTEIIEAEELRDVVLVGHSFGGLAISGAADRMPDRIRHLVYLDSLIIPGGRSPFDGLPADVVAARRRQAEESSGGISIPAPPPAAFGVPDGPDAAWVARRMTPHPIGTYQSPLHLDHPLGNGRPATYVHCTSPNYAALEASRQLARAQAGWAWVDLATGHDAMIMAPGPLADLLAAI